MTTFTILGLQVIPPSPTPLADPELLDKVERVISIWDSLGPLMAVLLVLGLAFLSILVDRYFNRNNSSTAINVLANSNTQKDKEISELQSQREQDRRQFTESMSLIQNQAQRANDLFEAMNNRGTERDKQQQRLVETQARIADEFKTLVTTGSAPVQEIKARVDEIKTIMMHIDQRTADWNGIVNVITPLLVELGALRTEAKKHSTQPIPVIDPSNNGITIEGTISGTITEGGTP